MSLHPENLVEITIALAGNPNCGKTSLFNELVGANQKVGNFSGVTVEKVEGITYRKNYKLIFVDLPGTYSLTAYSPEEVVARNYLIEEKPDVVVNVVDGTNLERNLYLTTQLMDLESNMLVALNFSDEMERLGIAIDKKQLQKLLGAHVVMVSAKKKTGFELLFDHIIRIFEGKIDVRKNKITYPNIVEESIDLVSKLIGSDQALTDKYPPRWLSIKLFENDKLVYDTVRKRPVWVKVIKSLQETGEIIQSHFSEDAEMVITQHRHSIIRGALQETIMTSKGKSHSKTEIIDRILINRVTGLPVFLLIMWGIFQIIFKVGKYPMNWIEMFFGWLGNYFSEMITNDLLRSVVVDGIISGVGGVLVFLPLIMLLFLTLSFIESTGYMARAAFVIDKVMHVFGLHGKSFIPMLTGFGCSVPAFMSTRVLKKNSDRITTLMVIPFMSCGAKLPVYSLIIGAFFAPDVAGNILFGVYLLGILIALISARIMKGTIFKGDSEPFVMELPPYRIPTLKSIHFQMWHKSKLYLQKAATVILLATVLIWLASNFPKNESIEKQYKTIKQNIEKSELGVAEKDSAIMKLKVVHDKEQVRFSAIGRIGHFIEPVIRPLGFDWKIGISLLSGFLGKEIFVSSMATINSIGDTSSSSKGLRYALASDPAYSMASAIALLIFVLLYVPCIAATIVFHREAGKWKYTAIYILYSMSIAWIMSFAGYQITLALI